MRIAIDARKIDDFGIGTYIRGLLTEFESFDDVQAVAMGRPSAEFRRVDWAPYDAPLYSLRELWQARRAVQRIGGVDLFHAPHYTLPFIRERSVVTVHDLIHLERVGVRHAHQRAYAGWMIGSALRRARAVITVSAATADALRMRFGPLAHVHVIPNGVDEYFREPLHETAIDEALAKFGLASRSYFLYVGNDLPHKNVPTMLAAFKALGTAGMKLALAGGAREVSADGVVNTGRVSTDDLRALYSGAIALLLVSDQEGFGLPVVEAMSVGTPVIASSIAALREVTGGNASFVAPRDAAALGAAMRQMMGDAALRRDLAARGAEFARRYSWRRAAAATLEVYRSVVR